MVDEDPVFYELLTGYLKLERYKLQDVLSAEKIRCSEYLLGVVNV